MTVTQLINFLEKEVEAFDSKVFYSDIGTPYDNDVEVSEIHILKTIKAKDGSVKTTIHLRG